MELLEQVGLAKHAKHRPNELSGGQRQRVAVARALVTRPKLVLADEPTANLDSVTGQNIIDLMKELNRKEGTTFIFSTHDAKVMAHANAVVRLADGKIVDRITPAEAAAAPWPRPGATDEASSSSWACQIALRNLFASRLKTAHRRHHLLRHRAGGGRQRAARQHGRGDEPQHHRQRRRPPPGVLGRSPRTSWPSSARWAASRTCARSRTSRAVKEPAAEAPQREDGGAHGHRRRPRHLGQHRRPDARAPARPLQEAPPRARRPSCATQIDSLQGARAPA